MFRLIFDIVVAAFMIMAVLAHMGEREARIKAEQQLTELQTAVDKFTDLKQVDRGCGQIPEIKLGPNTVFFMGKFMNRAERELYLESYVGQGYSRAIRYEHWDSQRGLRTLITERPLCANPH